MSSFLPATAVKTSLWKFSLTTPARLTWNSLSVPTIVLLFCSGWASGTVTSACRARGGGPPRRIVPEDQHWICFDLRGPVEERLDRLRVAGVRLDPKDVGIGDVARSQVGDQVAELDRAKHFRRGIEELRWLDGTTRERAESPCDVPRIAADRAEAARQADDVEIGRANAERLVMAEFHGGRVHELCEHVAVAEVGIHITVEIFDRHRC